MSNLASVFSRESTPCRLQEQYHELLNNNPKLRRKDAADQLNAPEADLIDNQCGVRSVRLNKQFKEQIEALPTLGYIMSLTRNKAAVHERKGIYSNVKINGPMGLVITDDRKIDLRIILTRWAYGFAVAEETPRGERFSLQFFDKAGVAIQKVFLQPDSNTEAYIELVERFINPDQESALAYNNDSDRPEYADDTEVDAEQLRVDWNKMTDVHQFFGMLRRYKISREQAFRLAGAPNAIPISTTELERVLNTAADTQLPIMCFVGNHGNIQIHTGQVETIKTMGPWLNVLDPEFNLHLLQPEITSAWLIRKPTEDGIVTSLEFYDAEGETVAQFFGVRQEGTPENPAWRELAESTLSEEITE